MYHRIIEMTKCDQRKLKTETYVILLSLVVIEIYKMIKKSANIRWLSLDGNEYDNYNNGSPGFGN